MRISVIAVGRLRPPFQDDVEHYRKMLAGLARVDLIEVREDERVPQRIPERAHLVLLSSEGREFDSVELSEWLEQRRQDGRDLCFVIGGPPRAGGALASARGGRGGLDWGGAAPGLSRGRLPRPHQLARVVLLEQLSGAHKTLGGEPYHY